mmetsp:Transcript_50588/g.145868  ORF Transcript_50588/g.145868 Transcript_50588/m.145868 type:complete len:307 (+) Transcript_50588:73-993(+)
MELDVPTDLYGLAIAEPAVLDRKLDGTLMYCFEVLRIYGMLCANYVVVCLFIIQLWKMGHQREISDCSGALLPLELGCVFVFEVRMLSEIRRGLSILTLLWALEGAKPEDKSASPIAMYSNLRSNGPSTGAVMVNEEDAAGSGVMARMLKSVGRNSRSKQWKFQGVSCMYRFWSALVVGIPKLVLDSSLAYLGGTYVMRSESDSEMVLNTLAVVFIAEIHELMYMAFTSDAMRYSLETMQSVDIELSNRKRLASWFGSCVFYPTLTVFASWAVVSKTRMKDCPDHPWSWDLLKHAWATSFAVEFME